jgi:hypothetical protein
MDWSRFDDHRRVQVVGAQYHQPALLTASERLIVKHTDRCLTEADLLREPDNPHDPSAVQVMVKGRRIGYLKAGRHGGSTSESGRLKRKENGRGTRC